MELTKEELNLLARVNSAGRWDAVWWEASYLLPSTLLIILGALNGSKRTVIIGLGIYLIFHSRMIVHQVRSLPVLKGLCEKVEKQATTSVDVT